MTALEDVPEWGGALMQWHVHDDLCLTDEPVDPQVEGLTEPDGTCRPPLVKHQETAMIHVWIVPHECGPFAALEGVGAESIEEGAQRWCDHAHGSSVWRQPMTIVAFARRADDAVRTNVPLPELLGWRITHEEDDEVALEPPQGSPEDGVSPDILFLRVPEAKALKNRLHMDLRPADHSAEVARAEAMGARRVAVGQGADATWVVLADPDGNEFCILRALRPSSSPPHEPATPLRIIHPVLRLEHDVADLTGALPTELVIQDLDAPLALPSGSVKSER